MIRARGLRVRRGDRTLLGPLDLDAAAGELVLLVGGNGSGKSTLLRTLGGTLDPDAHAEGEVRVASLDPRTATPAALARHVAQGFQHPEEQLLAFDVLGEVAFKLENLRVPPADGRARVETALREWGLERLQDRESGTLSGGEARRTTLAAALVTAPPVLLLDEPFAGLDRETAHTLRARLAALRGRTTMMVAEHRPGALAEVADRIIELPGAGTPPPPPPAPRSATGVDGRIVARVEGVHAGPLRDVTLRLGPGVHGLAGPNGAGKTTLLRTLAGFRRPDRGRVHVGGRVGYAPQAAADAFAAGAVRDELAVGHSPEGVDALAQRFGLARLLDRHPFTLSGGERQRLALACAVAHRPDVLLLDEPSVGLDANGWRVLDAALREDPSRCVVVATHDEDLLARCDRVHRVDAGRVREAMPA